MAMDQAFPKSSRICGLGAFSRVFEQGTCVSDTTARVCVLRNDLPTARIGVAVGRRHGSAAKRNRVKRLCREAFRLSYERMPGGWDYVIVPHAGREHTLERMQRSLEKLALRATQEASSETPGGSRQAKR